jgi:hypothetical protein
MTEERRAYYREYYRKNKERLYKQQKERFAKNPEKRKAVINRYAEKHREKLLAKNRDYKKTLKGCLAYKISHLKKAKRSRKLEVVIDVDFLLLLWEKQQGICAISSFPMRYPGGSLFSVTVDRIDPKLGYTTDNVQLVCEGINFAKNRYSNEEFLEFWNFRNLELGR